MKRIGKIIQTLWTKPLFEDDLRVQNRYNGGWPSKKFNYISMTLSCLQFRQFYDDLELITDTNGKKLIIDMLKLPYNRVITDLDCLNDYPTSLWTLPKIHSYQIQEEPFIHADGDVIIWERLGEKVEKAELCSQQLIINHEPQYTVLGEINKNLCCIPDCILRDQSRNSLLQFSSAGILGGTNIEFFNEFADISLKFVNSNLSKIDLILSGNFGMIFEEYLFYCLSKEKAIEVTYYLDPIKDDFKSHLLVDFETVPKKTKFIHPIGAYKKNLLICDMLEKTLMINYPEFYYRIMSLLYDFKI